MNEKSKKYIYETTGLTIEQIKNTDFEDLDVLIGKRNGRKIKGYIINDNLISRGQVYAEKERFLYMDEVDKGLKKHDRRKSAFVKRNISTV